MGIRERLTRNSSPAAPSSRPTGDRDAEAAGWHGPDSVLVGFTPKPGGVVLDIGCGDAPHSALLAATDVEILLADILPQAVDDAVAAVQRRGTVARVRGIVTDSAPIPLPDASVDAVIATEVVEHVPDEHAFLAELARVGRPGAQYLISAPDRRSEDLQRPFAAPDYFVPPNHVRVFDEGELRAAVEQAGLQVTHQQFDGFYQTLWWLFFWISGQPQIGAPWEPLMASWMQTWTLVLDNPRGAELKEALDRAIPKSEVLLAVKPQ